MATVSTGTATNGFGTHDMIHSPAHVVLIDEHNREVGFAEKVTAHRLGQLHRAVSVFILGPHQHVLIQRRSLNKYHSAGLWSNACCGHPAPNENAQCAATRRLREELGISAIPQYISRLHYKCRVSSDLTENELVHLFVAVVPSLEVAPNPKEVMEIEWIRAAKLYEFLRTGNRNFSKWLQIYLNVLPRDVLARLLGE